jgi:hypothetical protein
MLAEDEFLSIFYAEINREAPPLKWMDLLLLYEVKKT